MKRLISARGSYINAPPVLYQSDDVNGPILQGGFSDLPLSLAKYSFVNLTLVPDNSFGSLDKTTGRFDGIVGAIQRNESDYTLTPNAIDFSGLADHGHGVLLTKFLDQQSYSVASTPNEGTSRKNLNIYESFFTLDLPSFLSIAVSFMVLICWFNLLCLILHWTLNSKGKRRLKIKHYNVIWFLYCVLTHQSLPSKVPITRSHKILLITGRYSIFLLMSIILSGMRTEMVVFIPPPLINSLQDLLASNKTIIFDTACRVSEILKSSPKDSIENQIYDKAQEQAMLLNEGPVFDVRDPSLFIPSLEKMVKGNRAYVSLEIPIRIYSAIHCIGRYSSVYYQSKTPFHSTMMGLFFNEYVSQELRSRIEKTYNRAMAAGLFQLQVERAPYVSATIFGNPSLACLNEYEWDKTVNGVESYNLNLYLPLLYIVIGSYLISLVVLVKECLQKKLSRLIREFMKVDTIPRKDKSSLSDQTSGKETGIPI